MFFILSKILSFLTAPTTWITLLLIGYLIIRKKELKKKLLLTGITAFFFLTNPFIANSVFKSWEIEPTPLEEIKKHDIAVVFSGITMAARDLDDRIYFNKAADRITMAIHLYRTKKVNKILITGGIGTVFGSGGSEAESLYEFLIMTGIPKSDIIIEDKARNTFENAKYTKKLVDVIAPESKLILITSAFHMRRSIGCCDKVNLKCTPFAVDYHTRNISFTPDDILVPSSAALHQWDILVHEVLGYLVYWVTRKL